MALVLLLVLFLFACLLVYLLKVVENVPEHFPECALVTGGSSGIGYATAHALLLNGCKHITLVARDSKRLQNAQKTLQEIAKHGQYVHIIQADVSEGEQVKRAMQEAIKYMEKVDTVIVSAGASFPARFLETSHSTFKRLIDVNYLGAAYTMQEASKKMHTGGRIILVSSMAGLSGVAGYSAYGASKFAVRGMAEAAAMELRVKKIFVSVCSPPDVDTPMLAEEQKIKPIECKLISEGAGVVSAEQVAASIIDNIRKYRFSFSCGFDGQMLAILTVGTAPQASVLAALIELAGLGVIRCISLAYRYSYNRICERIYARH